jgi:hypothetical protein
MLKIRQSVAKTGVIVCCWEYPLMDEESTRGIVNPPVITTRKMVILPKITN